MNSTQFFHQDNSATIASNVLSLTDVGSNNCLDLKISIIKESLAKENYEQAIKIAKDGLKRHPKSYDLWQYLGFAYMALGYADAAVKAYKKLVKIGAGEAKIAAHYNLAVAYHKQPDLDEAVKNYKVVLKRHPDNSIVLFNLSQAYMGMGNLNSAKKALKKNLSLDPNCTESLNCLGQIFLSEGKKQAAIRAFKQCIDTDPNLVEPHRSLARLTSFKSKNSQFKQMEQLIHSARIDDTEKSILCFGLAKACGDLGSYAEAFLYLKIGNALKKINTGYDFEKDKHMFSRIRENSDFIQNAAKEIKIKKAAITPIFVVGMPRSGTTLVEQILSSHSLINGAGELSFLWEMGAELVQSSVHAKPEILQSIRNKYLSKIAALAQKAPFVVDKLPHNFLLLGLISAVFPEAKIISMSRDPAATCWSNFKHDFTATELGYSNDLNDTVMFYKHYAALMEFWHSHLGGRIFSLSYEKLVSDTEEEITKLIEYVGVPLEGGCFRPYENDRAVLTDSKLQVREKIYTGSNDDWQNYKAYLPKELEYFS
jgi:tetratricopeptide (TPR) repeat protein